MVWARYMDLAERLVAVVVGVWKSDGTPCTGGTGNTPSTSPSQGNNGGAGGGTGTSNAPNYGAGGGGGAGPPEAARQPERSRLRVGAPSVTSMGLDTGAPSDTQVPSAFQKPFCHDKNLEVVGIDPGNHVQRRDVSTKGLYVASHDSGRLAGNGLRFPENKP